MGKTAFVSSIDQLIHGDDSRDEWMDVVVRCYYCNRLEFRSTNDFVAVCNTALFSKTEMHKRILKAVRRSCVHCR